MLTTQAAAVQRGGGGQCLHRPRQEAVAQAAATAQAVGEIRGPIQQLENGAVLIYRNLTGTKKMST